jgi:hypothetical protein
MRRVTVTAGAALLLVCGALACPSAGAQDWAFAPRRHAVAPRGPLNTLQDLQRAIGGCWEWPPLSATRTGMDLSVLLSFKRDGEIFGARITYQSSGVSDSERALYYGALMRALKLCSPLPLSPALGRAIAGRPMYFRFHDTRQQRKA